MAIASLGDEAHSLLRKGGQGGEERAFRSFSRGDDKVLRTGSDGQLRHIDVFQVGSVLDGELEDGVLRFGLYFYGQTGRSGLDSACAHADVQVGAGNEFTVLGT